MAEGKLRLGLVTYQLAKDWDIPTIIQKCREAGWEAVELRTEHAHGVEPEIDAAARRQVKETFANSGVRLLSFGSICEYHSPDPQELARQIERTKAWVDLAADVGARAVKVRPNGLALKHGVPEEVTLSQIARALRECGDYAQTKNIEIWLEVHGPETKEPPRIRKVMDECDHPSVGVCWNCTPPDIVDGSVKPHFDLLRPWLRVIHAHELWDPEYPYRELFRLSIESGFDGYVLAEINASPEPDRLMRYYKALFDAMIA